MAPRSGARATGIAGRGRLPHRARSPAPHAAQSPSTRSEPPSGWCAGVYGGPKWTVSPVYEGMLKEEMDRRGRRHPEVAYQPVLIDATYAGLLSGATDARS